MKNYFSSPKDLQEFIQLEKMLNLLLAEQRHQRHDLKVINQSLNSLINDSKMQKEIKDFYEDDPSNEPTEHVSDINPV